ncbi:MAG TPA: hypothetical protein VHT51_07740 [Micropepsaceae bacterium]|jgi:hypothetical protein|nr:hypothetical protein [Micropepsaceae bacterium]
MLTDEFCLWLQKLLDNREGQSLTRDETAAIQRRLSSVFQHEIDPMLGDAAHQAMLRKIHSGN